MCGCLPSTPHWRPRRQPRHVPWPVIEPATLWFTGQHSIHWATPARDKIGSLMMKPLVLGLSPPSLLSMPLLHPAYIQLDCNFLGNQAGVLFIFTISHSFHHPYPSSLPIISHRREFSECMISKDSVPVISGKSLSTSLLIPIEHIFLNSEPAIPHWKYYF